MGDSRIQSLVLIIAIMMAVSVKIVAEDAVRCLKGVKDSVSDPQGNLDWNFGNSSVGYVCFFTGVSCWNPSENRVQKLRLSSMGISGEIPSALQFCSDTDELDLSGNSLSGEIPSELCKWLPNLVTLDLSHNQLSGGIPPEIADCNYLNTLVLSGNKLSGTIPSRLSDLSRLKTFSVSGNKLKGTIPSGISSFGASSFVGNSDLCGNPLGKCGGLSRKSLIIIIAAGIFGAIISLLLAMAIVHFWLVPRRSRLAPGHGGWADRLRHHRHDQVSLFQKPIVKVRLGDLMAATNDFSSNHLISSSTYRAVLSDGSILSVKRLPFCNLPEKEFRQNIAQLGLIRHPNLVPLLGFCSVLEEHLLIYKHMPGSSLFSIIPSLDWSSRLKIAVGAARGLAWLHHGIHPPLIHGSFSSSVVLLDDDGEARITEFGLANLIGSSSMGEMGYVAPEYHASMVPSMKADVYSFGVFLMELASGQKPVDVKVDEGFKGSLVDWVTMLAGSGLPSDAIDGSLRGQGQEEEVLKLLKIACSCAAARPKDRAPMYQVYQSLKGMASYHDGSADHYDEFPLVYGRDDRDTR